MGAGGFGVCAGAFGDADNADEVSALRLVESFMLWAALRKRYGKPTAGFAQWTALLRVRSNRNRAQQRYCGDKEDVR